MERIRQEQLKNMEKRVNEALKGTGHTVLTGGRYGYTAIDIGYEGVPHSLQSTLLTGLTKREAYDILYGMARALEMKETPVSKRRLRELKKVI